MSRQTLHAWLTRYEPGGIENLGDGSQRPRSCPHQMPAVVEVAVAELRRAHPTWGPRRPVHELGRDELVPPALLPSEAAVCRALVRLDRGRHSRYCVSAYLMLAHRLTRPRSPTTTGKVERFHRRANGKEPRMCGDC